MAKRGEFAALHAALCAKQQAHHDSIEAMAATADIPATPGREKKWEAACKKYYDRVDFAGIYQW